MQASLFCLEGSLSHCSAEFQALQVCQGAQLSSILIKKHIYIYAPSIVVHVERIMSRNPSYTTPGNPEVGLEPLMRLFL